MTGKFAVLALAGFAALAFATPLKFDTSSLSITKATALARGGDDVTRKGHKHGDDACTQRRVDQQGRAPDHRAQCEGAAQVEAGHGAEGALAEQPHAEDEQQVHRHRGQHDEARKPPVDLQLLHHPSPAGVRWRRA